MAPVKVLLSGVGNISRRPERGIVTITISSKGTEQAKVSKDIRAAALAIENQVRSLALVDPSAGTNDAPAVERWYSDAMTSRSSAQTYWVDKYDNVVPNPNHISAQVDAKENLGIKEKIEKTHFASMRIVVRFRDFTKLSECTNSLSLHPLVEVTSVSWELTEETKKELHGQVIKEAYKDAYEKATAFAEAIGVQRVQPVSIKPQGSETAWAKDLDFEDECVEEGDVGLNYVPRDLSFDSAWDLEFELS